MLGHPSGRVRGESSDKTWSTGGGNGKPLQDSCLKNPMNNTKGKDDMTPEDEPSRSQNVQYTPGEEWRAIMNSSRKTKQLGESGNDTQLQMCLVMKVKLDAMRTRLLKNLEC